MFALPGVKTDDTVALFGENFPAHRRCQRLLTPAENVCEKGTEKGEMPEDFRRLECAEIIVGHKIKVRFDLFAVISR